MRHHKSSIAHALQQLYPEVRFDMDKFENASCIFYYLSLSKTIELCSDSSWDDSETRRNFFIDFAITRGFDYQHASNWYAITKTEISETKV